MDHLTFTRRATTSVLLASHVLGATGCTSWQTQSGSAASVLAAQPVPAPAPAGPLIGVPGNESSQSSATPAPQAIRITTATTKLQLDAPRISGDSLYGTPGRGQPEIAVPLSDVTSVQVRATSAGKTAGLGIGLAVGAALAIGTAVMLNDLGNLHFGADY